MDEKITAPQLGRLNYSIRILIGGDHCAILVPRGTQLPFSKSFQALPYHDFQRVVELKFFIGNSTKRAENLFMDSLTVQEIPHVEREFIILKLMVELTEARGLSIDVTTPQGVNVGALFFQPSVLEGFAQRIAEEGVNLRQAIEEPEEENITNAVAIKTELELKAYEIRSALHNKLKRVDGILALLADEYNISGWEILKNFEKYSSKLEELKKME